MLAGGNDHCQRLPVHSQLTGSVNVSGLAKRDRQQGPSAGHQHPHRARAADIALGAYKVPTQNLNATTGYNAGSATKGPGNANGGGASSASGGSGSGVIVEVAANVGTVIGTGGSGAGASSRHQCAGSSRTVPTVVRTSTPNLNVPQASLFRTQAGRQLPDRDRPAVCELSQLARQRLSAQRARARSEQHLKRLGDGFYEQKLIREQVAQLTGYRYLDGFNNDEDQYAALMNAGVTFAKQYGLRPGSGTHSRADGTAHQRHRLAGRADRDVARRKHATGARAAGVCAGAAGRHRRLGGAAESADAHGHQERDGGDVTEQAAPSLVGPAGVHHRRQRPQPRRRADWRGAASVLVRVTATCNNIGASITAREAAVLTAGGDINVVATAPVSRHECAIYRVAGVYVTNPGGVLMASAGARRRSRSVQLWSAQASVAVSAGHDVNLGTTSPGWRPSGRARERCGYLEAEPGSGSSAIRGQDNVSLAAGNSLNIRAGAVASGRRLSPRRRTTSTSPQARRRAASPRPRRSPPTASSGRAVPAPGQLQYRGRAVQQPIGKTVALVASNGITAQARS